MGLSFCALQKKPNLKDAPKVPLDNPSKCQYNEIPTEPRAESQSPPAVVYITSIWEERQAAQKEEHEQLGGLYKLHKGQRW